MSGAVSDPVRIHVVDGVSTAVLNRPDAGNALDRATADALASWAEGLDSEAAAGRTRVAVLRHEGSAFCVGGDLRHFMAAQDRAGELSHVVSRLHAAILAWSDSQVPVISVVDGVAAGGGLGLALGADLVIASERARFASAYIAAGLSTDCGGSWVLTRRLGLARAMELVLTNRVMRAEEAAALGLVSQLVPSADLEETTGELARELARGPFGAIAQTKRLLRRAEHGALRELLADEADTIVRQSMTAEGAEGAVAFLEKRSPRFV